jgi:hypothetical protein
VRVRFWSLAAAPPDDANLDGFCSYLNGARADARWGLGFPADIFYEGPCSGWNFGVSYQSPTWLDEFQINSPDELGAPRHLTLDLDYPAIFSFGAAYRDLRVVDIAADVRYIDYNGTAIRADLQTHTIVGNVAKRF